jgi:hypothetical protein
MSSPTPTKCPRCGEPPQQIVRVREQVTSGFGDMMPEPRIVERATCKNGHQWFASDERRPNGDDDVDHG